MSSRNEKNYIFIVGNGFDLNLGLESKFYDFILHKYFEGYEKLIQDLYKMYLENNDHFIFLLNFLFFNKKNYISWEEFLNALKSKFFLFLYFCHNYHSFKIRGLESIENLKEIKYKNWSDIESTLSYILKKIGNKEWFNFNGILNKVTRNDGKLSIMSYQIDGIYNIKKILFDSDQCVTLIKESLKQFEIEFNSYIFEKCKKINFSDKLSTQWAKYIHKYTSDQSFFSNNIVCLSFNYTICDINEIKTKLKNQRKLEKNIPNFQDDYHNDYIRYINIHGHIMKQTNNECSPIIIGIDDSECGDFRFSEFTKSYKVAKIRTNNEKNSSLLFGNSSNNLEIYFYGHSLSKNDYSYFQSIFDTFDLYSKNVHVHFVYPTDENNKDHSRYCDFKKIYELIHQYGYSFNNKNKGQNLFSKLLLEDRLKIHFIDWSNLNKK